MADLVQQELNKKTKDLKNILKELKLEVSSRSGLIPYEPYIGSSSLFNIIWEVTCQELIDDIFNILKFKIDNTSSALQQFRDKFINTFMILHHKYRVKFYKFNWNWD